jgi:hypothetical protein
MVYSQTFHQIQILYFPSEKNISENFDSVALGQVVIKVSR